MPIGKACDHAGAFIDEGQRRAVLYPFEIRSGIALGLVFDRGDFLAPAFGLGLNHAGGLLVHEQDIVRGAGVGRIFPHRNAGAGIEIDFLPGLNLPAGLLASRRCGRGLFVPESDFGSP